MYTKITVIYDNPSDPDAFELGYAAHLAMAKRVPGLEKIETSKVWPKEDGSPTPAYRLIDMYFRDYPSASAAVVTPEASAFLEGVFALATGGVRIVFASVEEQSIAAERDLPSDVAELAGLLRETAEHHDTYEKASEKHDWWDWYAAYLDQRRQGRTSEEASRAAGAYMADVLHVGSRDSAGTSAADTAAVDTAPAR